MSTDPSLSPPEETLLLEPRDSLRTQTFTLAFVLIAVSLVAFPFLGLQWAIVICVAVLLLFLLGSRNSVIAAVKWKQPSLQVSSTPYDLGSTPTVVYCRRPKRVRDISPFNVECLLVCEEKVTYRQGTDTRTDKRRVFERRFDGTGEGSTEGLVAELELEISAHMGAPSLDLPNNEVVWFAEFRISDAQLPRDEHTFVIKVAPVLDPAHRVGLQDT